jgi:hypothetical protein
VLGIELRTLQILSMGSATLCVSYTPIPKEESAWSAGLILVVGTLDEDPASDASMPCL